MDEDEILKRIQNKERQLSFQQKQMHWLNELDR